MLTAGVGRADEVGPAGGGGLGERAKVAILPMVVNSTGEQGYLRSGLSDMLASRLGRNPGIAVVRVEADSQATTNPRRAAEIAAGLGAQFVVFGSFTQFGQGASLDVQCLEVRAYGDDEDPNARRIFIQSGTVGDIIPKLDETAQKISRYVSGPAPAVAAGPPSVPVPAQPAPAVAPGGAGAPDVEALRRRVEAIEEYLFGSGKDDVVGSEIPGEGAEFGQP